MKLFTTLFVAAFVGLICLSAELNYKTAISAAQSSEGTDSAIESTMSLYGFNVDWHEDITMKDKVIALFK